MRYLVLVLALLSMVVATASFLGIVSAISEVGVSESGIRPHYSEDGYMVRVVEGRREIFLPRDPPNEWYTLVDHTDSPVICHVASPMVRGTVATLHADGKVTISRTPDR